MIELVRRRMMMGAKPYDAEVEWIQGSPGYRINADVNVSNNGYSIKERVVIPTSSQLVEIFEKTNAKGQSNNLWYLGIQPHNRTQFNINQTYGGNESVDNTFRNSVVDVYVYSNTYLLRWLNKSVSQSVGTPASPTGSILLFSRPNRPNSMKLYFFQLFTPDGSIIRDFIPVRKGNTGYLYDRVSGRLFDNMYTTGYAIIGPDKTA